MFEFDDVDTPTFSGRTDVFLKTAGERGWEVWK
jgi:hypothetical protein